ncbi:MAG: response regulator [Actinomycetota bacterium]|nr:response regulator [Actinomycetota bacterium]
MIIASTDLSDAAILIVDDQYSNVVLLQKILAGSGFHNYTSTTDPRAVEELVGVLRPDLILLDLQMAQLDGFEVMRILGGVPEAAGVPIIVLTADISDEAKHASLGMGAKDFLTKPLDPIEVMLRIKTQLETRSLQRQLKEHNELLEARVRARTEELWSTVRQLEKAENDLLISQAETVRRLSIAAEFRDDETARHIVRMSHYCAFLAAQAGLDDETCRAVRTASQMHDVGKIGTPDSILLKKRRLTPEERAIMERHAEDGWSILEGSESALLQTAATIALTHHERVDGTGYPQKLGGEDIPLLGRIAAIADVFDALSTNRVYRPAFPLPEVWRMMREGRGTQFDADLLDLFFDSMDAVLTIKDQNDEEQTG